MKRSALIILSFVLVPVMALAAADQYVSANATATINTVFGLTISSNSINFGNFNAGTNKELLGESRITVTTNSATPWGLKTKLDALVPDISFSIKTSGGVGTQLGVWTTLDITDTTSYTAAVSEYPTLTPLEVMYSYQLVAGSSAAAGVKLWTLTYTLTETL